MRLTAVNTQTRIMLAKLIIRMEEHPGYSREIGLTDVSQYLDEDKLKKKEVEE